MKFGYFDDNNKEYVITNPRTPYPWINYLGNEDFYSLISNTSGGYSFYKDARLRRLTRYRYNNIPLDSNGKYFYIVDDGQIWNPGWQPTQTELDRYECRHGLGYTQITGMLNHLQAEVLSFVPLGYPCEIQQLRISNQSTSVKKIKLFSFVEWCLWNALDDMTNFQRNFSTGEVELDGSTIYHKTEYKERRNHYAFYSVNTPIQGYDTDRESFLGLYNGLNKPVSVFNGAPTNSIAHGWSPVASHYIEIELEPGEEKELIFILGYGENPSEKKWSSPGQLNKEKAREMMYKFNQKKVLDQAFEGLKQHWSEKLSHYQVHTPDDVFNRSINIWNQYQCIVTYCMSRSASYFESGIGRGMGFRDSNQDIIGFVHMKPDSARQRILDLAATQFEDGGAYHQYQPLTKKGNDEIGSNFNDDPLWLICSVVQYVKETGDFKILDETVPFDNNPDSTGTLMEHLKRSFDHVINNLGPHKLPLIGRADWNDCLNLNCFSKNPDESFQTTTNKKDGTAESVFIAGMFVLYGKEYADLCSRMELEEEAARARSHVEKMKETIEQCGWDGQWFVRAYDHYGNPVGSKKSEGSRIFIEPQGFCVMAGIGLEDGKAQTALDSVKKYLDSEHGIVLNNPPYTKYHLELGEISTYPPGYKENAGVFSHNNPWIIIAETMLGHADRAYEYYKKITPTYREENSERHRTEPYVYAQMTAGKDAIKPGESKNSWLTGTAAWAFYCVAYYILGIRPMYDGLCIDPCIPKEWDKFKLSRRFRGAEYQIEVLNPHRVSKGVQQIFIDGKRYHSNVIPIFDAGTTHQVTIVLGSKVKQERVSQTHRNVTSSYKHDGIVPVLKPEVGVSQSNERN